MNEQVTETEDKGDLASLFIRAGEALMFSGPGTRATVRFAIDEQWFSASVVMIDESEAGVSVAQGGVT